MNKTQRLNEIENSKKKGAGPAFFHTLVDMYLKLEFSCKANFKTSNKGSL